MQLFLMKRGGQVIYSGELGQNSSKLIEYFEVSKKMSGISVSTCIFILCLGVCFAGKFLSLN